MRIARYAALMIWVGLGASAGCSKDEQTGAGREMPPPVAESEAVRGIEACKAYATRVCACAEARPGDAALAEQCHMAPAKLRSLEMVLEVNKSPKDVLERVKTSDTARRIAASCIEEQGALDGKGCPR